MMNYFDLYRLNFPPIFLHVSKYCCTFEGEYRKEESLPEETKFEVIPKIGEGYF